MSEWGEFTYDRWRAKTRLLNAGVEIVTAHNLLSCDGSIAKLVCTYTGRETEVDCEAVVLVTARTPDDQLYQNLVESMESSVENAPKSIKRIGDCEAPAIIAAAVYSGHKYARELDVTIDRDNPLKHDRVFFEE